MLRILFLALICLSPFALNAERISLADIRLKEIVDAQQAVFDRLENNPSISQAEQDRLLLDVNKKYRNYFKTNSRDITAYIFYGKFLRNIGQNHDALAAFGRANALDNSIPVVKQQMAILHAEAGQYIHAYIALCDAISLSPTEAQYHFEFGELVATFKNLLASEGIYSLEEFEVQMLGAFQEAARLEPKNWTFALRFGQAHFDLKRPDYKELLKYWKSIEQQAPNGLENERVQLYIAQSLIKLRKKNQATKHINRVFASELEGFRRQLLEQLKEI